MSDFIQYTTDYISGVMSLREPQKISLEILADIINLVNPTKNMDLEVALAKIKQKYHNPDNGDEFDFERSFMSLTFALATGVGKTRLMGAFIAYLYTQHKIKNFFVVAPSTTIYDKLKSDLGDSTSKKYVFQGLGCFTDTPPRIIKDDDYRNRSGSLFSTSGVNIFIFNIDKFNRESTNMNRVNEYLGESFYNYLARLNDLVLIMDESHHYRAEAGFNALNNLHPLLGLELTATPYVTTGSRQEKFKNVVYDYPTDKAIADGFLRTPYAMAPPDFENIDTTEDVLEKRILWDGINHHEKIRNILMEYAINNSTPEKPISPVKPFVLIVCRDTDHAEKVKSYICSDGFKDGYYRGDRTIIVHSRQSSADTERYTRLLLGVERSDNPVEIVIHVNKLKEGWDVNNLYTIIPLRTATSKILREQMVGRGLRLPYGKRTGDEDVDSVMLTAHDNFNDILEDIRNGKTYFKRENIVPPNNPADEKRAATVLTLRLSLEEDITNAYNRTHIQKNPGNTLLLERAAKMIVAEVYEHIFVSPEHNTSPVQQQEIVRNVSQTITNSGNLTELFAKNKDTVTTWMVEHAQRINDAVLEKFIPIPETRTITEGLGERYFNDFNLDLSVFNHAPLEDELLVIRLVERTRSSDPNDPYAPDQSTNSMDLSEYDPKREILGELKEKPEINYAKDCNLLFKLITQVCEYYEERYDFNNMRNIAIYYKSDIANKIYNQMMDNFCYSSNLLPEEEIIGIRKYNLSYVYRFSERVNLNQQYTGNIHNILFDGIEKGVWNAAKFDSAPELELARILEREQKVLNWLKPAKNEFRILYHNDEDNRVERYIPDFVVETKDTTYLVEVKGDHMLNNPDVLAKKAAGIKYCKKASDWCGEHGYKKWKYVLIPSSKIMPSSSFMHLVQQFVYE